MPQRFFCLLRETLSDGRGLAPEPLEHGSWELTLPADALGHGNHYKLLMEWDGGSGERIPAWARYVVQDPETHIFTAVVWEPKEVFVSVQRAPRLGRCTALDL